MSALQQNQLWIGVGFAFVLVGFFIYAFKSRDLTQQQLIIVRFLAALCAGFAGALIAGEALFKLNQTMSSGMTIAVSGTAGFALFFTVWFTFPTPAISPPPHEGEFTVKIPAGWTFQQTVDVIVSRHRAVVDYSGFTKEELAAPLKDWEISARTVREAIVQVRSITAAPGAIREYDVTNQDSTYRVKIH